MSGGDDDQESPSNERSVKELQKWLAEFGRKNKNHFVYGKLDQEERKIKAKNGDIEMKLQTPSQPSASEARRPKMRTFRVSRGSIETIQLKPKMNTEEYQQDSAFQPPLSVTVPNQTAENGISDSLSGSWGDFEPDYPPLAGAEPPTPITHMHSTNVFHEKTFTADSLDLICKGFVDRKSKGHPESPSKSETGTTSLTSVDSELPSVHVDAVDSKLAHVFSSGGGGPIFRRGKRFEQRPPSPSPSIKKDSGKENENIRIKLETSRGRYVAPARSTNEALQRKLAKGIADEALQRRLGNTAAVEAMATLKPSQSKVTNRKFGGENRSLPSSARSGVAQRQEELQRLFAQSKAPKVVTKVKWQVDSKSGTYKKKVTLENLEE